MKIDSYRFGKIVVDGEAYSKDVILLAGEVISPWWRSAGGHVFAPEDLEPVLSARPEVVVLGLGYFGRVRVAEETFSEFSQMQSEVLTKPTKTAVESFNRLVAEGRDVVAALHLTC